MKKNHTLTIRLWTYASILSLLLGAACSSPRISQLNQSSVENTAYTQADDEQVQALALTTNEIMTDELTASISADVSTVAAAATRPISTHTVSASAGNANKATAPVQNQVAVKKNKARDQKQVIAQSLSFPARVMLKSIAKKAQKLEKKMDIKQAEKAKDVNNGGYLIAGIILAAAGLVLIIAGNTTLLYILGAGASLAGLVFLLLALL